MAHPTHIKLPSKSMQAIYNTIQQIGSSNIPILITGETGTGKESLARYIHKSGKQSDKLFIAVNCGEHSSELFGHEGGVFKSAIRQRRGALETADGGILFLDEFSEMSLETQKKLLRVLDIGTFTRLGGNAPLTVDIHIIAATSQDIKKAVANKEFREDLYYRLKGIMLHLSPLRERPADIAPLVGAFISEFSTEYGKDITGITPEALTCLKQAVWLGNIRQLKSTIQSIVALATTTDKLKITDFPDIHIELTQALLPIWHTLPEEIKQAIWGTLPPETQHTTMHELKKQTGFQRVFNKPKEILDIENMNLSEILHAVAQNRIKQYSTRQEAADSLGIDTRTLLKYAGLLEK